MRKLSTFARTLSLYVYSCNIRDDYTQEPVYNLRLQKEPKLARAKHIPEWEEYDNEIAGFARELKEKGIIHSGAVDADSSILAEVGAGSTAAGLDDNATSDAGPVRTEKLADEHPRDEL